MEGGVGGGVEKKTIVGGVEKEDAEHGLREFEIT